MKHPLLIPDSVCDVVQTSTSHRNVKKEEEREQIRWRKGQKDPINSKKSQVEGGEGVREGEDVLGNGLENGCLTFLFLKIGSQMFKSTRVFDIVLGTGNTRGIKEFECFPCVYFDFCFSKTVAHSSSSLRVTGTVESQLITTTVVCRNPVDFSCELIGIRSSRRGLILDGRLWPNPTPVFWYPIKGFFKIHFTCGTWPFSSGASITPSAKSFLADLFTPDSSCGREHSYNTQGISLGDPKTLLSLGDL